MVDSSQKSLEKFTFAYPTRKSPTSSKKRLPRTFATVCWFHKLKLELGVDTVVAVQKAIEQTTEDRALAVLRKWSDYKNGRHKPSASVMNLAEKRIPGSKEIFQFLLWEALRLDNSAVPVARRLQGTTLREGDELLNLMLSQKGISYDNRWLRKRCRALVASGTIDGLAVLTICIRLAGRAKHPSLALTLYRHATHCLMILGSWFYSRGIAQAIAEYYEKILLPACCTEHKLSLFRSSYYLNSAIALAKGVMAVQEAAEEELNATEIATIMLRLIDTETI